MPHGIVRRTPEPGGCGRRGGQFQTWLESCAGYAVLLAMRMPVRLPCLPSASMYAVIIARRRWWRRWAARAGKPCHDVLYSGGAFTRLYPVNPNPTRNHAARPERWSRGRYWFALDIWRLVPVP